MAKSAQQKLEEFVNESVRTRKIINEFATASYERHRSFAHAAGFLESYVGSLVMELPKARREAVREELLRATLKVGS